METGLVEIDSLIVGADLRLDGKAKVMELGKLPVDGGVAEQSR